MEFNLAQVQEAVGQAISERDCIIQGERRLNCGELRERTRRLANFLGARGLGATRPRSELSGSASYPLQVLGGVVEVEADVVLPRLPARELGTRTRHA